MIAQDDMARVGTEPEGSDVRTARKAVLAGRERRSFRQLGERMERSYEIPGGNRFWNECVCLRFTGELARVIRVELSGEQGDRAELTVSAQLKAESGSFCGAEVPVQDERGMLSRASRSQEESEISKRVEQNPVWAYSPAKRFTDEGLVIDQQNSQHARRISSGTYRLAHIRALLPSGPKH